MSPVRTALIIGSEGQDGRILFDRLGAEGDRVIGVGRATVRSANTEGAALPERVDVLDPAQANSLIRDLRPDEVYYLAAYHHSSEDPAAQATLPELIRRSMDVHVNGLCNVLEALRLHAPHGRLFYAASSHVFGEDPPGPQQDERTPLNPANAYAITKVAGMHACRLYRRQHGLFASVGILFNHESALRRPGFLTRRIVEGVLDVRDGKADALTVGDPAAQVDWGYAPDTVDAMVRILRVAPQPDEFVVATGEAHTVSQFADVAFRAAGVDPAGRVRQDPNLIAKARPSRSPLVGNAAKLRTATGWRPGVTFEEMVALLVRDADRARRSS